MIINYRGFSLIDPVHKRQWAKLCFELSKVSDSIAKDTPYANLETKNKINCTLGIPAHLQDHVWAVPNHICTGSLSILNRNLNIVANILNGEYFVTAHLLAPHIRIILEITGLLTFLDVEDEVLRTVRSLDTLSKKMKAENLTSCPTLTKHCSEYSTVANQYKNSHPGVKVAAGSYTELVRNELSELDGGRLYASLSSYNHHNAFIGLEYTLKPNFNPTSMESEALDYTAMAVNCAIKSALTTISYRDPLNRREHVARLRSLEDEFMQLIPLSN